MLFDKIRKTRQPETPKSIRFSIACSPCATRLPVTGRVPVADLFGLAGREETRPRWPHVPEASRTREPERVRPEDVPSNKSYVSWE